MTKPDGTKSSYSAVRSTSRPRRVSTRSARSASLPTQSPTGIGRRPLETMRSTIAPGRSVVPALGSEVITMPSGTVSENFGIALPNARLVSMDPGLRLVDGQARSCGSS